MSDADLVMYKRRHALQLLLSLHDSPLADMPTRRACVHVLLAAAAVPEGASASTTNSTTLDGSPAAAHSC